MQQDSAGQHKTLPVKLWQHVTIRDSTGQENSVRKYWIWSEDTGQHLLIVEDSSHSFRHTTFGRTPLDEWSARLRDVYLTTHNIHKTQMPPARFEPAIPASERPQIHALDGVATHTIENASSNCLQYNLGCKLHFFLTRARRTQLRGLEL